jgi:hypothetical protein
VVSEAAQLSGSECWALGKLEERGIEAAQLRFLRSLAGGTRRGHVEMETFDGNLGNDPRNWEVPLEIEGTCAVYTSGACARSNDGIWDKEEREKPRKIRKDRECSTQTS